MGEPWGQPEHPVVIGGELHTDPVSVGGRTLTNVHSHVEYGPTRTPNEMPLSVGLTLEVQTSDGPFFGCEALVILGELDGEAEFPELAGPEGFTKRPSMVLESGRFDDSRVWDRIEVFNVE